MTNPHSNDTPPSGKIVWLTPEEARLMLKANTRNRPVSRLHVLKLLSDMQEGRWQYNGEAIKVSDTWVLLDGQHRLEALAMMPEGTSLPFLVVYGLAESTQETMDQGRVRSAGDQFNIDNLASASTGKTIAAAVRVYIAWENKELFSERARTITNPEIVAWARSHPAEIEVMNSVLNQGLRKLSTRPAVSLASLTKFYTVDSEAAHVFHQGLVEGTGLEAGNPMLTLREKLFRVKSSKDKVSDREIIGMFVLSWNAFRERRSITKIQRPEGGVWTAANFPVVR